MTELFTQQYKTTLRIAMPGKYVNNKDSYVSINHALTHACAHEKVNLEIVFVDTEKEDFQKELETCDGILLTPGFGHRGVDGMIKSAEFALINKIPYLGICFGAQMFYIAFMRHMMKINKAHSTEIDPETDTPVVTMMDEQMKAVNIGGTMRLGAKTVLVKKNTKLFNAYKQEEIRERFRHRYHIIDKYHTPEVENQGLIISAYDKSKKIVNAIELNGDHWMVGVQFHPEYTSRPFKPSPIYHSFIKAVKKNKEL